MPFKRKKSNKSIVSILRDRELNIKHAPYFSGLKIASQLIRSDKRSLYNNTWNVNSPKEISYDSGNLYFSNYTQYCSINASYKKPPQFREMEQLNGRKKISDVISYSGVSGCKNIEDTCQCETQRCMCLSQYLLSISEDNWLCQHHMVSKQLMKEIYVKPNGQNMKFKYCDWDIYGERFVLRNPTSYQSVQEESDVVINLAVFTTFPIEFYALLEIKRSVFGQNVTGVCISNQSLIIGLCSTYVTIYNFDEFLNGGTLTPYKLGDSYGNEGKIGTYPTGLPLNFTYRTAPPALFKVKCMGQIVRFGGYPYHYIIMHPPNKHSRFSLTSVATETAIDTATSLEPGDLLDPVDTVMFHPDQSNRIILKKDRSMDVYKIITQNGNTKISRLFSMRLSRNPIYNSVKESSYDKFVMPRLPRYDFPAAWILCSDYEDKLGIFAVVSKYFCSKRTFVTLYDSVTGEELRSIILKEVFSNGKIYEIYMDLYAIIVLERDLSSGFAAHVLTM